MHYSAIPLAILMAVLLSLPVRAEPPPPPSAQTIPAAAPATTEPSAPATGKTPPAPVSEAPVPAPPPPPPTPSAPSLAAPATSGEPSVPATGETPPAPVSEVPAPATPPPLPTPSAPSFWVAMGQQQRQMSLDEIEQAIRAGRLTRDTLVWKEGFAAWRPAGTVGKLQEFFAAAAPVTPPPPPPVNGPQPPSHQPGPPPLPRGRYWVVLEGKQQGPFARAEIRRLIETGRLSRDTLVWKEGTKDWVEARKIPDLARLLPVRPPAIPQEERIKRLLVGSWSGDVETNMGGMALTTHIEVTFHPDGTLTGTQTSTAPQMMEGMPAISTTLLLEGTWKVRAMGRNRFTLIEKVTAQGPGAMGIQETHTSRWTILDRDTLRNEDQGYEVHRTTDTGTAETW